MDEDKNKDDECLEIKDKKGIFDFFFPKLYCPYCKKRIIEDCIVKVNPDTGEPLEPRQLDPSKKKKLFAMPKWYVLVIFLLVISFSWVYMHDTEQCRAFNENQCEYCQDAISACFNMQDSGDYGQIDFSKNYSMDGFD